jgi:hypothetical protein
MRTVLVDFSGLAMARSLEHSASVILSGALALAIIASIDALLCAKLTSQPGELRAGDDRLLIRLGIVNAVSAGFGGITNGINIGPSLVNRAFGGRSLVSVLVNAGAVLLAATALFPLLAYIPRAVLSATIMVIAIQHIEPWTKQLAARLIALISFFSCAGVRLGMTATILSVKRMVCPGPRPRSQRNTDIFFAFNLPIAPPRVPRRSDVRGQPSFFWTFLSSLACCKARSETTTGLNR